MKKRESFLQYGIVMMIVLLSLGMQIYFGIQKQGFHEDEYYSYYSTNLTNNWSVPEAQWEEMQRYRNEFMVLPGEGFQYGLVKTVQSWDVHPPMYYWILHTVCSFSKGVFSKWQGLIVNMIFQLIATVFLYCSAKLLFSKKKQDLFALLVCAWYAFSPAIMNSVMFIRMYTVLSAICMISVWLHIKIWLNRKFTDWKYLISVVFVVYIGFLTHYYYLLFQFFLTGSMCVFYLFREKKWKEPIAYGGSVLFSLFLAYLTYPACLGQMFRGQRGAEATANMFDLSSLLERCRFFFSITDRYLLGSLGIVMIPVAIVVLAFLIKTKKKENPEITDHGICLMILWITVAGYFLTVSKSALLLGDSSIRYILPSYGLLLLVIVGTLDWLWNQRVGKTIGKWGIVILTAIMITGNIVGVFRGKVIFLFQEDNRKVSYAREHSQIPVVYIYQKNQSWCVWESANELFEYPRVYFYDAANEGVIEDQTIANAEELLVYIHNFEDDTDMKQKIYASCSFLTREEIIEESKFCTLYRFY